MMQESKLVRRGFTYSREARRWVSGKFAILIPMDKNGYDYPTEGKYEAFLWLALWDGVPIAQGSSLQEAIKRIEDEGYIPVFDEEGETAADLIQVADVEGNDANPNDRYMEGGIPAHCFRCKGPRVIVGYITAPRSYGSTGGGWQVTGKCTTCWKRIHVTIKREVVPSIPESVKAAAYLATGIPAAILDAEIDLGE